MQNDQRKYHHNSQSGFWFGLLMGGVIGSSTLFMFGTKDGRKKFRNALDAFEDMDREDLLREFQSLIKDDEPSKAAGGFMSDITQVLDKIQSTMPTRKEVQKYFVKDGKLVK